MAQNLHDEPNMSDATLLVSVEDIINRALGPPDANTVNFKLIQMILNILARQQRMLEHQVEIRVTDMKSYKEVSTESSSSKSPRSQAKPKMAGIKEEPKKDKKEKEKEKDDKKHPKEKPEKGKDKGEKTTKKEKEKEDKQTEKETKHTEKDTKHTEKDKKPADKAKKQTDKEKKEKEKDVTKGAKPGKAKAPSATAIVRTDSRGRASIDVVTMSQFALLEAAVNELKDIAVPKPLVLPDNEKLKSDIARGSATLPDTMQAMQVTARVKAAEDVIGRMTGLLTQLAAAGALPEDLAEKVGEVQIKAQTLLETRETAKTTLSPKSAQSKKSVAIDLTASQMSRLDIKPSKSQSAPVTPRASNISRQSMASKQSTMSMAAGVTQDEMNAALRELRDDVLKNLNMLTTRATMSADNALHTAMNLSERLDVAVKLDTRITTLFSLVADYSEQLSGFDAGLATQMQSFKDQMVQIHNDLNVGLTQLQNVNNNAEDAAVLELSERYQELVSELEATLHAHKTLTALHSQLGGEMHSLVECVEMLREQKCDRDEVLDGLRDKADTTRLAGLLRETDFAAARADFERRLELCHDKFNRQETTWMAAIKDLTHITDNKAEIIDLLSARDEAQKQLQMINERIRVLATVLGEPKAALLTRALAMDATCGACQLAAHMAPRDATGGAPAPLPALRPPPEEPPRGPCLADWIGAEPKDDKHICRRWCGGSHTLLTDATTRERATTAQLQTVPTTKYTGHGIDGRLYMMEEELQPCIECNRLSKRVRSPKEVGTDIMDGAGDSPAPLPTSPM